MKKRDRRRATPAPRDPPGLRVDARWFLLGVAALALATGIVYRGVLENDFVSMDDNIYIYQNAHIHSFSLANLRWMLTDTAVSYWHPVAWLAHAVDYGLFGLRPGMHHATSVVLHVLNAALALLLFVLVMERARGPEPRAGGGGRLVLAGTAAMLAFALHPLRVESVAWASEKKDLLCGFFTLAAFAAHLMYGSAAEGRRRRAWYAATLALSALALMSKPMAVTIPLALLVLDFYPLRRLSSLAAAPGLLLEKLPLLVMSVVPVAISLLGERRPRALPSLDPGNRLLLPLWGSTAPLVHTLWPWRLLPLYPLPLSSEVRFLDPAYGGSAALLLAVSAFCVWRLRRGTVFWLAAWLYYLVTMLPVMGLRQMGDQETADRFSYLPTLSLYVLFGAGLLWLIEPAETGGPRRVLPLAVVGYTLAVLGLGALSQEQIRVWRNSETLWTAVVAAFPTRAPMAHNNLGMLYFEQGVREENEELLRKAEAEFRTAIAAFPGEINAYNNLGLVYFEKAVRTGDEELLRKAEVEYRRALAIFPQQPSAYNNLGMIEERRGATAEAERDFLTALRLVPDLAPAHRNLAIHYHRLGRELDAAQHLDEALRYGAALDPELRAVATALGRIPGAPSPTPSPQP